MFGLPTIVAMNQAAAHRSPPPARPLHPFTSTGGMAWQTQSDKDIADEQRRIAALAGQTH
jgi:hypothetical protein